MTQLVDIRSSAPESAWFDCAVQYRSDSAGLVKFDYRLTGCADARLGYSMQRGDPTIQCYGSSSTRLSAGADVNGTTVDGSAVRLARAADPDDAAKYCWHWRVHPDDPLTSSSKRGEFAFNQLISQKYNRNAFVVGMCIRLPDIKETTDDQLVWQLHGPDGANIGNPYIALLCTAGQMRITLRYDENEVSDPGTMTVLTPWTDDDWVPEQWYRWAALILPDHRGRGRALVLRDGVTVLDYSGPFGYNDDAVGTSYFKNGYYHWTNSGNDWDTSINTREVWHKGAYIADGRVSVNEMDDFLAGL